MKYVITLLLAVVSGSSFARADSMHVETFEYDSHVLFVGKETIRAGYLAESPGVTFKGDILFLEGLGDSMLNHAPLFSALSGAGYRVISFDYLGQGGSTGTMNHTRVVDSALPSLEISSIAEVVRAKFARGSDKPTVMGWSLGGLAAYQMGAEGKASSVILIAPSLKPDKLVGDLGAITLETLTSSRYNHGEPNPHVDPVRPTVPAAHPLFAANVIHSGLESRSWRLPEQKGLALLARADDGYVDNKVAEKVLRENAPKIRIVSYPSASHELDNEPAPVGPAMIQEILKFLAGR